MLRWTAPVSGVVSLNSEFGAGDGTPLDVYIQRNGVTVWDRQSPYTNMPFSFSQTVDAGDHVDFLVAGRLEQRKHPDKGHHLRGWARSHSRTRELDSPDGQRNRQHHRQPPKEAGMSVRFARVSLGGEECPVGSENVAAYTHMLVCLLVPEVSHMRLMVLLVIVSSVCLSVAVGAEITSALDRRGPAFAPGMTPSSLGWGEDTVAYPERFVVNPKDGGELCWVPAGQFQMGSSAEEIAWAFGQAQTAIGDQAKREWFDDEAPAHPVRITKGFWMYRCEVTNGQFRRFKSSHKSGVREGQSFDDNKQPAVRVSWRDAQAYCDSIGVKLPTEAQWEYACRAGTQTRYFWGDDAAEVAQYANVPDQSAQKVWREWKVFDVDDGHAATAPVGSFRPNAFGLHDMIGNANEWCEDRYAPDYYQNTPEEDPPGPTSGDSRAMRGGSWSVQWYDCRCGNRNFRMYDSQYEYLGFRPIMLP